MLMRKYEVTFLVEVWAQDGASEQEVREAAAEFDELRALAERGKVTPTNETEEQEDE